ncbi:MAG: thioredoxin domain-containing protein [Candidatus Lokiarchaeota archaeon]|nr:thioredoxin domain-containing protein [Candidatus Lokiarchaeota archaeon]
MSSELLKNYKNHLSNEKSPYLLQHVENPVDWYPWGEEAFNKANQEDKPIFLSIGYSTCHWCHVMAHESFEDEEIAELLNEVFVSIKVDREERPDIDKIYMTVCQMMTGSGGWPLTIIMTPDKKPFFAGTYFPKHTRFGRIGLIDLIKRIKELWNNQRTELINSADQITFSLQNIDQESPGEKFAEPTLRRTFQQLSSQFDSINSGFGNRPKFPTPHHLIFLLRYWKRTGDKKALEMVEKTLQEMRKGGIYDHIGFGFHRYSTDSGWLVPHFEKMLYDQALIAIAYIEAYQATKNAIYKQTAEEMFAYVLRDMTSEEGGFYSAEDADSEGEEGKFYIWSKEELEQILGKKELGLATMVFNIEQSGNYLEESSGKKTGRNILHLKSIPESKIQDEMENIRIKLFNDREKRIHPHKDDKILTDWNGLMIAALVKGAVVFQEKKYLNAAKNATDFLLSKLRESSGKLLHRYKDGSSEIQGYLGDYAFFIWGLIELYEATFDVFYLKTALELHKTQIDDFWDENIGGFYFTAKNSEKLLTRQKEIYDGAIPSGNSIAMLNLLRLSYITGNHELEEKADILSRVFSDKVKASPLAYTQFLVAIDFAIGPTYSLVIAGDSDAEDTKELISTILNEYIPNKVFMLRKTEQKNPDIDNYSNFVEFFYNLDGKATAYICINKTCKPPTHDIHKTLEFLKSKWE